MPMKKALLVLEASNEGPHSARGMAFSKSDYYLIDCTWMRAKSLKTLKHEAKNSLGLGEIGLLCLLYTISL